ncbi:MAG: hypothetical protein ACK4M9_03760 [Anaerobacillus sp.]|uniref:hypothetical protein n=1 Tax=Anaerobacillus sp. TaxID=1872506 RepID=UPI00391A1B35
MKLRKILFSNFVLLLFLMGCTDKEVIYDTFEDALTSGLSSYSLTKNDVAYVEESENDSLIIYHPSYGAFGFAIIEKSSKDKGYSWVKPRHDIGFEMDKSSSAIVEVKGTNNDYRIAVGTLPNESSAVKITGVKNVNDINTSRGLFFYILDEK